MPTYRDKNGKTIHFERMELPRLVHELFVEFLGDRSCQDRKKHDGLDGNAQEFKEYVNKLVSYAYNLGIAQEYRDSEFLGQNRELLNQLTNKWTKIE